MNNQYISKLLIESAELLNESGKVLQVNIWDESNNKIRLERDSKLKSETSLDKYVDKTLDGSKDMDAMYGSDYDNKYDNLGCDVLAKWKSGKFKPEQLFNYLKSKLDDCDFKFIGNLDVDNDYYSFSLRVFGMKYYYQTYGELEYTDDQSWGKI